MRKPSSITKELCRGSPTTPESHNNLAWLYATCEDPKWHDPGAALEHARRAVDLTHWKQAEFVDTLAEATYASGSYPEAVRIQLIALQLDPQNPELQAHLALAIARPPGDRGREDRGA